MPASTPSLASEKAIALLQSARKALQDGDTAAAIAFADDCLELYLKHLCLTNGCDDSVVAKNSKGEEKPFLRWGFTEYMRYLDSKKLLSKDEKSNFFTFHEWRNLAHHHGVEPREKQAELVIDTIETFIKQDKQSQLGPVTTDVQEVADIHPMFRANPFLVESGCRLEQGEKYLSQDSLNQIDLALRDSANSPLYAEIKWSGVDLKQVDVYKKLLKDVTPHRLMWLIPSDLVAWKAQLESKDVEVKQYDRNSFTQMALIRRDAKERLKNIQAVLTAPFEATIYDDKIRFSNVIEACYFQGRVKTDKGLRELGLKQTATGRQLDLFRCVVASQYSSSLPELATLLIRELLHAPFYYKSGRFLKIAPSLIAGMSEGFMHGGSVIVGKFNHINGLVTDFCNLQSEFINQFYGDLRNSNLLWRVIQEYIPKKTAASISVKEIILAMKKAFLLIPTSPPRLIKHSVLNAEIPNLANVGGFENDMARRLVEIATLKRLLIPVSGLAQMWVLVPRQKNEKRSYERVPCQNFTLNDNPSLYLDVKAP